MIPYLRLRKMRPREVKAIARHHVSPGLIDTEVHALFTLDIATPGG
jgi:hypothetical protein